MKYMVLGSVEVHAADGRNIRIDKPRHRQVLAALLLMSNNAVSIKSMIDLLWGDAPPSSALGLIRTYVWGLRRVLAPGELSSSPIQTLGTGYRIVVDRRELDLLSFAQLSRDGRAALASGDFLLAEGLLSRALDLWRGAALEDVRLSTALANAGSRLDDERLNVLEDWIETRLRLGSHGALIAVLRECISVSPFRERLWGQLMLALYRSGRRAEALQAFCDLRRRLGQDLGIEPSHPVRLLHQRILAEDPDLQSPAAVRLYSGERARVS